MVCVVEDYSMPINLTYDAKHNVLIAKVEGVLTVEAYQDALDEVVSSTEYPSDVNAIWDLTDMAFHNVDYEFEKRLIEIRSKLMHKRGTARLAIVSNYDLGRPLVELFLILTKGLSQEIELFETIDDALDYMAN